MPRVAYVVVVVVVVAIVVVVYDDFAIDVIDDVLVVVVVVSNAVVVNATYFLPLIRYANKATLVWNAPLRHQAGDFVAECLDHHFGEEKKWHFWSLDEQQRPLVSLVSKVIDRLKKRESKLAFMKTKKA
jgi:hypothetical protein